jgi:hypothetical protein
MTPEEKNIEQRILPYRFWLSVCISAFLILAVVLYLPLRFQRLNSLPHSEDAESMMHEEDMNNHGGHGTETMHEEEDIREGIAVNFSRIPLQSLIGTTTFLSFFVNEKPDGKPIPSHLLSYEHEKLMHVIGIRDDLEEFFHIHPEPAAEEGVLSVEHIFSKPGIYKIFSEIKIGSKIHSFGHQKFRVEGFGSVSEKNVSFARNRSVGGYRISLSAPEHAVQKKESELTFDIHTLGGEEVSVENYLGARMHLAVIKDDLSQFVHTHPEEGMDHHGFLPFPFFKEVLANGAGHASVEAKHGINFHVAFPEPGLYKVFAQFRPQGTALPPDEALLASFWIRVEEKAPFAQSQSTLIAISVILMVVLGAAVKKYLTVPP